MQRIKGFLLTRHWRDTAEGLELSFWAHGEQGPLRLRFPRQQAVCFMRRQDVLGEEGGFVRKPLQLEALDDGAVDGLYFSRQRDLQAFRRESGYRLYESDVKPHDRFLMERFVRAPFEARGELRQAAGFVEMLNPRLRPVEFHPALSYLSLDIETDVEGGEVLSIALSNPERARVLLQGNADDWPSELPLSWYADEAALLRGFLDLFQQWDPDLILGWNLINFDLDYLERRCRRHGLSFSLGRAGEQAAILQPQGPGQVRIASIPGRVAMDGIDNLRAAFWQFESFELGAVARQLLGKDKLIEQDTDKVAEILRLYQEDRAELAAYNLEDCRLVEQIVEQTRLIDFVIQRARMTGLPLCRQGGSVAAFDNLYLPRLHRAGCVAPDLGGQKDERASPGGYVLDSSPGLYENVLLLDFKSLYPSIIRTFQIDPYGLARPGEDPVPGFLDASFSRSAGLLPEIITELWQGRDQAKADGDQALSQAIKIIMNSFYGVLGSPGCRFHDARLASSITRRGHEIIRRSREFIEQAGYRVIYGDTDSVFVLLGPGREEPQVRQIGKRLVDELNRWWRETLQRELKLVSRLEIEFETHFIRFLMPTIRGAATGSKKRYAGLVRNKQGQPEMVFKGLESVRSDWTPLARDFQRELYRRVFLNEPWKDYLLETVSQLRAGELDRKLVYRKRLRRALESYQRNVPPHVQAARKLDKPGRWIEYLITLNGPQPVQKQSSPVDYQHYLERQLAPAADGLLHFLGEDFEALTASQMDMF